MLAKEHNKKPSQNMYIPNPLSAHQWLSQSAPYKFLTDLDNKRFGILFNLSCYWSGSSFPYDFLYLIDQSFLHLFEWLQTNRQICCLTDTFIILKQSSYIHWKFFFTPFLLCQQRSFSLSTICPSSRPLNIVQNQKTDLSPEEKKKSPLSPDFLYCGKK